jgi:cytochrome c-type biogenesis protein CcmH/NrfG
MSSFVFAAILLFTSLLIGAAQSPSPQATTQQTPSASDPPEEDASQAPKTYVLNPLESERNIKVGDFYWKKKDYRGALDRYRDATRYNPSSAEAFLRMGEAEEKLSHADQAKFAFQKVIQLAPDSKFATLAKKKLGKS